MFRENRALGLLQSNKGQINNRKDFNACDNKLVSTRFLFNMKGFCLKVILEK